MENSREKLIVGIVGAGPIGCCLSRVLVEQGFQVDLYEKRQEVVVDKNQRSINITISHRSHPLFKEMGIFDEMIQHALPMNGRTVHLIDGTTRYHQMGAQGFCTLSNQRSFINELFLKKVNGIEGFKLFSGTTIKSYSLETTTLTYEDETGKVHTKQYDFIIGTDGAFSTIRKEFVSLIGTSYSQKYLDLGYIELQLPPNSEGKHSVDGQSFNVWPRDHALMIAMPNRQGNSLTCNLYMPLKGPQSFEYFKDPKEFAQYFTTQFPDAAKHMPDIENQYKSKPISRLCEIRIDKWIENNVAILGDACHAIYPFYGQGINRSFEDCMIFKKLLLKNEKNLKKSFQELFEIRKPQAEAIADLSIRHYRIMKTMVTQQFQDDIKLSCYLMDVYPGMFFNLFHLVLFTNTEYTKCQSFIEVEEQILNEVRQVQNYLQDVEERTKNPLIEEILSKYSRVFLPQEDN